MLVMTHRKDDKIYIGNDIVVTVIECSGGKVRLGFTAPDSVKILRDKVKERDHHGNQVQND